MPPSLPIEVEERIIGFLADGYRYYSTIKSCALVCRAWLPKSRAHLFQNVRLPGSQHLHNMLSLPSSTIERIAYNAREVEGRSSFNGEAFHHLIPHFLATKLPRVERLLLDQDDGKHRHVFPPSFFMHLTHFRNVHQFDLENYQFTSFTELRRLVASLPHVVNVSLRWVSWPGDLDPVRPLLRATKWKMRHVTTRRCTSDMCPLWFWIVPPPSIRDIGLRGAFDEGSHPGLKQDHAKIISQVIRVLVDNRLVSWHTVWHCVSQNGARTFLIQNLVWISRDASDFQITSHVDTTWRTSTIPLKRPSTVSSGLLLHRYPRCLIRWSLG